MRAAVYTRVSTEFQAMEGHSLEAQHDKLMEYLNINGWELHRLYTDPGVSAKNLDRPGVQEMIRDLKKGLFNAIIVHKLDRLTRNISDLYDLVEMVNKHDIKFISLSENIDTSTPMGRMFVYMLGIFAQLFRENLAEEVRKGMSKRAEKGLKIVSVPMFGYTFGERYELVIHEEEAKWVQWIFGRYLQGIGTTNIAKELNEMGIRRSQGARWDQHKVMITLKNVTYTGHVHWKPESAPESERIIRKGIHEPIIDSDTYKQVQRIIQRRSEGLISRNSYEYVFGGIIRCGKCGGSYKGKYNKRANKGEDSIYRGYVCSNNERYGTCDQSGISELRLTKLLFEKIDPASEDYFFDVYTAEQSTTDDQERTELQNFIDQSEARRKRWQMAYGDGFMPYEDFSRRMEEEMEKLKDWEQQLNELPHAMESTVTPDEVFETISRIKEEWKYFDQDVKKQIMQSFFQRIVIVKEGSAWVIKNIKLA